MIRFQFLSYLYSYASELEFYSYASELKHFHCRERDNIPEEGPQQ